MKMQKQSDRARSMAWPISMLVIMLCVSAVQMAAQEAGGTILGVVTDPTSGAVSDGMVTIKNTGTGVDRVVQTNADGLYVAPNLIPGTYELNITATGFTPAVFQNVVLTIGERREIDARLTVGQVTSNVTVSTGEVVDVDLASSAISGVVESQRVVDLPLNGRDWTSLELLQPGVAQVRTQSGLAISNQRANRGLGTDVTIGGNRPQQNNYRLDGVSINDFANGAPGSVQGSVLGVDAVQEFSVVTSNAPPDSGKTAGGVINAASRSGTNNFHGTAYEFLRNSVFDARNVFDIFKNQPIKIPFKRNQFGASAGGPIIKDHTFFFADYEGLRQSQTVTNLDTVPSPTLLNSSSTNAAIRNIATKIFPSASQIDQGSDNGNTATFTFLANQITTEDFFTTRIDHKLSSSDTFFGTYLFDRGQTASPDAFNFKNIGTKSGRHTVALEESHIFTPELLNSARFGFNRTVSIAPTTLSAINPAAADTSLGFVPGLTVGLININSNSITPFQGGLGAVGEYDFHYNSYQATDDLNWTRTKHSLKFGFYAERIQSNQLGTANPNGQFIFNSLANFVANIPASFNAPLGSTISPRDLRQSIYAAYDQDDYKFRPNLTFNIGLRYEMATVPTETANRIASLVNLNDAAPRLGAPYFSNPTLRNFSPRVGFAWDPFGSGKTSVRGAFGLYDVLPLPYEFELISILSAPYFESGTAIAASGDFPTGAFRKLNVTPRLRYGYVEQDPHRSYVEQWTLNIQRELFPTFTITAGYVGSHGVHLPTHTDDVNDFLPIQTSAGFLWPTTGAVETNSNPGVGQISALMWAASSTYHSLNVQAIKRLSHGVQIQGSYTFSKSIDTSSSGIAGDTFGNSVSSLFWFNPGLRRGLSDFDVRHVAAINGLWMIPGPQMWSAAPKWVVSGWQVGGIYTLASGLPFTPTIGGDPLGLKSPGGENFDFPNRRAGCNPVNGNFRTSGTLSYINLACFTPPTAPSSVAGCTPFSGVANTCANLLGSSGRNTAIGPGLSDFDFSLFKNNPIHRISEGFNIQFRWEVFNILNRANYNPPNKANRNVLNPDGTTNNIAGRLTSPTTTSSRQMQFALKFIW